MRKRPGRRRLTRPTASQKANSGRARLGCAVALLAALLAGSACGGGSRSAPGSNGSAQVASVQVVTGASLSGAAALTRALPRRWALSIDVRSTSPNGKLSLGPVELSALGPGWHHLEATSRRLMLDGRGYPFAIRASTLTLRAVRGTVQIKDLVVTDADDPGALLLHRLAELHARLSPSQFPVGADLADRLHLDSTYWTSGFWPGALWQAAALVPGAGGAIFRQWALTATLAHFGGERADTHDVGFEYGESSLAAWRALCSSPNNGAAVNAYGTQSPSFVCATLRRSGLAAASELVGLERSNAAAGTLPTNSFGPRADTIIDSVMNAAAILPWASSVSGNRAYARVALRHAQVVARLLVRSDGSTAQAVEFDRANGRVLSIGTRQGLSASSTWSRGQGWAVYGFSRLAEQLHDRGLLRVAMKTAGYVERHLPPGAVPRWDYDAPAGAPVDVSAGVITAAGLFHLAAACRSLPGVCGDPGQWIRLGRRMLAASLSRAYAQPPLGLLPDQVLNERGRGCWCNGGELMFGVTYALEGLNLERQMVAFQPVSVRLSARAV